MIREGRATNAAVEIKARDIQTYFGQDFGTVSFDRFRNLDVEDELAFIRNKILYAFYGRPVTESVEFTTAQVAFVTPIYEKICECKKFSPGGNNVCMSVLYVCVVPHDKSKNLQEHADILSSKINTVPLFKVRKCIRTNMNDHRPSCFIYIDEHCRVYSDWKSYLENNKLPKGVLVAPKDGKYQFSGSDLSSVLLEMCLSPQSSPSAEANENMENASLITGFMSMGVFAASFVIPVAGPILIGAAIASTSAGAYGLVSSSKTLADRYTHEQSISLLDSQARDCWINIAGSTVGLVNPGTTQVLYMAARNMAMGNQQRIDVPIFASIDMNFVGIGNVDLIYDNINKLSMIVYSIFDELSPILKELLESNIHDMFEVAFKFVYDSIHLLVNNIETFENFTDALNSYFVAGNIDRNSILSLVSLFSSYVGDLFERSVGSNTCKICGGHYYGS